jgi:hypothetical protein
MSRHKNKYGRKKRLWEHWGAWAGAAISILLISVLRVYVGLPPIDGLSELWVEVIYNTAGFFIGLLIGGGIHRLIRLMR